MIRIIGQELELRIHTSSKLGEYRILDGMGLPSPEHSPKLECWTGMGPHSIGALRLPIEVSESGCVSCGAEWFVPFLRRLKVGQSVPSGEIEACHVAHFGKPMLRMDDPNKLLTDFYSHLGSGGIPESFFPCCRIVKTEWDDTNRMWKII